MEVYPEKVATTFPPPVFQQVLQSINYGLKHQNVEINRSSLEALRHMAFSQVEKNSFAVQESHSPTMVEHFIKSLLHIALYEQIDSSCVESLGLALFGFIMWNEAKFNQVVTQLLQSEGNDKQAQARVAQAFGELLKGVKNRDTSRPNLKQFSGNFDKLLLIGRASLRRK